MGIEQIVTGGGIVVLLATIIGYLLHANWRDRTQQQTVINDFRQHLNKQTQDYEARLKAQTEHYDARLNTLEVRYTAKIEQMEKRIDELEQEVENERNKRVQAELKASALEYRLSLLHGRPKENGV